MVSRLKKWLFQNIANAITVFGLILSVWLLVVGITFPENLWLITLLALLIGLTDFFDGKAARYFNINSFLGSCLDRLRDKIFVCPALIILLWYHRAETFKSLFAVTFTATLVIVIIFLECLLLFAWLFAITKKLDIAANQCSRIKMFLQFIVIMVWLISLTVGKYAEFPVIRFSIYFINVLLVVTVYFSVKSLDDYYQRYKPNNTQDKIR